MTVGMDMEPQRFFSNIKCHFFEFYFILLSLIFNYMKKIVTIVLLFTSFLFKSNELKASHAAGGELVYTLVNAATNTYKFTFKFYRDCS
jgi:hypothetical protein